MRFSKEPIPDANAERVIEVVQNLEKWKDVSKIVEWPGSFECSSWGRVTGLVEVCRVEY